jgi:hypothetical protein
MLRSRAAARLYFSYHNLGTPANPDHLGLNPMQEDAIVAFLRTPSDR